MRLCKPVAVTKQPLLLLLQRCLIRLVEGADLRVEAIRLGGGLGLGLAQRLLGALVGSHRLRLERLLDVLRPQLGGGLLLLALALGRLERRLGLGRLALQLLLVGGMEGADLGVQALALLRGGGPGGGELPLEGGEFLLPGDERLVSRLRLGGQLLLVGGMDGVELPAQALEFGGGLGLGLAQRLLGALVGSHRLRLERLLDVLRPQLGGGLLLLALALGRLERRLGLGRLALQLLLVGGMEGADLGVQALALLRGGGPGGGELPLEGGEFLLPGDERLVSRLRLGGQLLLVGGMEAVDLFVEALDFLAVPAFLLPRLLH